LKLLIAIIILSCSLFASSITDSLNREVKTPKDINQIIAIGPGALRLVTYMDVSDKIVGIEKMEHRAIKFSEYRTVLGEKFITSLPIIGAGGAGRLPNIEKLIELNPDVIIASFLDKKQLDLMSKKSQIPFVSLSYGSGYGGSKKKLAAIKNSLSILGELLNKQDRAKELIDFMSQQEKLLVSYKIPASSFYVGGMGFKGAHGITSTERDYPSFELLGIKNALAKDARSNHLFIQKEALILKNPDFIFLDIFGKKMILEQLKKEPAFFEALSAYKTEQIYWLLPYNFYNTNVANVYINSWIILSKLGYDIDVKQKMKEIYSMFYGDNYKKLIDSRFPLQSFK